MEVTSLILNVRSDTVETGAERLGDLTRAAATAQAATTGLATSQAAGAASASRGAAAQTTAAAATARTAAGATTAATATGRLAAAQAAAATAARGLATASRGLAATMAATLLPLLALLAPLISLNKIFDATVELQDYQARLKTATGSVEKAGVAFEALTEFASSTPYALEQSLEAFIQLTNLGLTPSERALTSYGNTASAMGKDLTDLVEAVADATTGEFERLKEFGIKAKSEGERVAFTFRGVTTEIGKNADEIEEYLTAIGENEFGGAMAEQMATVGGQVSNLGDTWNELFRTISEMGVGSLIGATIQIALDALTGLVNMLKSGEFEASFASWVAAFDGWAGAFELTLKYVTDLFQSETEGMGETGSGVWDVWLEGLKNLPASFRYWMQRLGVELGALIDYGAVAGEGLKAAIVLQFEALLASAKNYGKAIGAALNPFDSTGYTQAIQDGFNGQVKIAQETASKIAAAYETAEGRVDAVRQARLETIGELETELGATAKQVDDLGQKSDFLREKYEAELAARAAARGDGSAGDRLAQFKITPEGAGVPGVPASTPKPSPRRASGGGMSSGGKSDFDRLVEDLRKEENAIEESYLRRLKIVRDNTEAGSAIRAELENKLESQYQEETEKFAEKTINELDISKNGFTAQLEELERYYDQRRELILANETLTENEKTELVARLTKERNQLLRQFDLERAKQGLELANDYFANFSQLADSNNKKLAKIGAAGLKAQKAISIVQTTIKTYESATSAYAAMASIPYVGPALGVAAATAAIAAGLANVAAIATTNNSVGSYASGGIVPGSSFSGDKLTANVNSSEMILNQGQQARLFEMANGSTSNQAAQTNQGLGGWNVNVYPLPGTTAEVRQSETDPKQLEIILKKVDEKLTSDLQTGGGRFIPALSQRIPDLKRA